MFEGTVAKTSNGEFYSCIVWKDSLLINRHSTLKGGPYLDEKFALYNAKITASKLNKSYDKLIKKYMWNYSHNYK